jgi:hypothetical protein
LDEFAIPGTSVSQSEDKEKGGEMFEGDDVIATRRIKDNAMTFPSTQD